MVDVVTKKEFDEFKKDIEDRLYKMGGDLEKRLNDLSKIFGDLTAKVDEDRVAIHKKIDDVEEKSKSVVTRIKEAFEAVPAQKDAENP